MSIALVLKIRPMTGFTFGEKSILYVLADVSKDGETVFLRMNTLSLYAGCDESTARRLLRRLERIGVIVPQGGKGGRGYVHSWRFNLTVQPQPDPEETQPALPAIPPREETQRQFKTPMPTTNHRLSPENEEHLQRLRRDLAMWQGRQANHIQTTGQPLPAYADWIDLVEQKIAKLEKKIGET